MATIGSINIGMGVNKSSFGKRLREAERNMEKLARTATAAKNAVIAFGSAMAIKAMIGKSVMAASDLNEQVSKTEVVFGAAANRVKAEAQRMADAFGVPKKEFLDSASSIGLLGKAAGLSQESAAKMANQFAELAIDASSFYNVPLEEAMTAIRSGLTGEAEPMKRFGVLMNEAAVATEAANMGIAQQGQKLTEQQKVMARASLMMKGMKDAQGDLARTSGGVANQMRSFTGRLENFASQIGETLAPVTGKFLELANQVMVRVSEAFSQNSAAITSWASNLVESIGKGVEYVSFIWRNWTALMEKARLIGSNAVTNIGETILWLGDVAQKFIGWLDENWINVLYDIARVWEEVNGNMADNFRNFVQSVMDWVQSGFSKPFEFKITPMFENFQLATPAMEIPKLVLSNVDKELAKVDERIKRKEEAVLGKPKFETPKAAKPESFLDSIEKSKESERKFAAAMVMGSTEARSTILKGRGIGGGKEDLKQLNKTQKDQLKENQKQTQILSKLASRSELEVVNF